MKNPDSLVNFGNQQVTQNEKTQLVDEVFETVNSRYNFMNDIISLGTHRALKQIFIESAGIQRQGRVLDVACGTGDITALIASRIGKNGNITAVDFNASMLKICRDRLLDLGHANVNYVLADAQYLPLDDRIFDGVTMAFGIRNMSRIDQTLAECLRVLRPGGQLSLLEFSHPESAWLVNLYKTYTSAWPLIGQLVVGDSKPYRYLAESIQQYPRQDAVNQILEACGFRECQFENLLGGIVSIHTGIR